MTEEVQKKYMKRDEKEIQLANPRYDFIPTVRGSAVLLVSWCVRGVCLFVCLLVLLACACPSQFLRLCPCECVVALEFVFSSV